MKSISLILKLLFVCIPLLAQQLLADAVFRDGDFDPANWETFSQVADDPTYSTPAPIVPNGSVTRKVTGGNPNVYLESSHRIVGGATIFTGAFNRNSIYVPSSSGAIEFVDFQADVIHGTQNGETAVQLVLQQAGIKYYQAPFGLFRVPSWTLHQSLRLQASDFDTNPNIGLPNAVRDGRTPDFSVNGAPIKFGYALGNGLSGAVGQTLNITHGIDNWQVRVISSPPRALSTFINQGSAQRSMIQGIGMTFDRDVSSQLQSKFLKARNIANGQIFDFSSATLIFDPRNFSATWMLDKNTVALLPDGNYIAWLENDRMLDASSVGKFSASHVAIDDFTFGFHQLAGDSDGDRDVDFLDASVFRDTLQKSLGDSAYRSQVDFDLNDSVAELDRTRMKLTYFTVLTEKPALHAYLRTDTGESQTDNQSSLYDVGIGIVGQTGFTTLEARLDGRNFVNITAQIVSPGKAILSQVIMDSLAGGSVSLGAHQMEIRGLNANGISVVSESLAFENLGPVNLPPIFNTNPNQGVVLPRAGNASSNDLIFEVPGLSGEPVTATFNWTIRSASYNNEFGIYRVSDRDGRVSGILPSELGYASAALTLENSTVVFQSGEGAGAVKSIPLVAGDLYGFYLIQNGTTESFRAQQSNAFFSLVQANFDEVDHLITTFLPDGETQFAWEDLTGVGDQSDPGNFKDVVFTIDLLFTQTGEGVFSSRVRAYDPEGQIVTYHIVNNPDGSPAPSGAVIDQDTGDLIWIPSQIGTYFIRIEARDPAGTSARQTLIVKVVSANLPPEIQLFVTDSNPLVGALVSVRVIATDEIGLSKTQLFLDGVEVALDATGLFKTSFESKGIREFRAYATDVVGLVSNSKALISVRNQGDPVNPGSGTVTGPNVDIGSGSGPSPLVEISAPNGAVGEDLGRFIGSVNPNGGTLANWRLDYAPQATVNLNNLIDPAVLWVSIAAGTDVKNNAPLGNIDSTLLANTNFVFRLLAYNTNGKGAVTTVIFNPRDTAIPKIAFTAPVVGSEISYQTEIKATIDPDGGTIDRWILDYAQAAEVSLELLSNPAVKWTELSRGNTAKTNAAIGTLDATMLRNDSYVLRIRAWNTNGRGYQLGGIFNVTGQSKLGNFRVQFTDLSIPLQGIPIQVTRIYDSLETGRFNDFGYGWSLALGDADIRETVPDTGGDIFTATPFKIGTRVYLTTPEGKRVGFTFKLRNPQSSFFFTTWEPYFEADRGVYEKLTLGSADNTRVSQVSDGSVVYPLFQFGFNPNDYLLTLQNGTVYHYDQKQGLKDVTDLNGNTATFTDNGIRHSSGVAIDFVRDTQGRITSIKAPNGTQIGYVYDASGDLTEVTNQLGAKTSFGYHASLAHYLEKIANPNDLVQGRFTQKILYDANGRVSQVQDGDGNVFAKQDFVPGSFTGTRTDGRGFVTNLTYDRRGNLLSEQSPEGGITRYEYSDPANPDKETAIIDPLTRRREFTYDSQGNRLTEKDPLGNLTIYGYNALGKITSLTRMNAANVTLSTESAEYDADGNLTKLINCAGDSRTFAYVSGRLEASTDFEGNATQYDYTNGCPCGSPSKIIYPDTTTKLFEYNAYGQVTKVTDETGAISRFLYDAIGRKTQEIDHDGNATVFDYDENNNLVKRTDRLGRISKFEYNAKNLLVKEIKILTDNGNDADDVILSYEYDEDDRLEALVDPMANRTEFAYDRDGRLSTRKDALGKSSQVFYDLAGNTKSVVDRNGRKRSFDYDERNLPTKEFWHAPNDSIMRTISIGYDDLSRRTSISDPDSTYGFTYDACSRVQTETNAGTPLMPAVSFTYGYDKDGNRTSVTDNSGVSVTTGFDSRGRSASFKWQGGGIAAASVDLDRNGRGQMTAIKRFNDGNLGNLVSQSTYDQIAPQGWVKQVQHKNNLGNLYNSGSNFTYGYDAEGQVTSQASQGNSTIYSYDPTGQLTGANHTAAAYTDESYQYDKAGNRISSHLHASYTTGTANRLQSDGQFSYSYDDEGNTVTKTEIATGKVTSYIHDHRGRVTSLTERASVGGAITSQQNFTHDVLDRRIGIVANGVVTRISYLDENAWADYNAAGVATKRYLFADRIDGNLANWTATNGTQWYLTDKLGSIRALTNSGGALGTNVGYDSFGNNLAGSGIFATERYGFTGRENVAAGTMFYRSRFYNSGAGRFIGEDRIDFEGGDWNLYRYGYNSPHVFTDPSGSVSAFENAVLRFVRDQAIDLLLTYTICSIIEGKDDPLEEVLVGKGLGLVIAAKFKAIGSTIAYSRQIGGGVGFVAKIVVCIAYD